jgi:hypothetical protein
MWRLGVTRAENPSSPLSAACNGWHEQAFNALKLLERGYVVLPPLFGVDLASTLLREDQALLALSYRQELLPSLYDASRRWNQPAQARSGRVKTVNMEFKCACAPDFERHRSLPDM